MSAKEMRFIVVGKTGNGKSSAINSIAGRKMFEAKPSQVSVTKNCQKAEVPYGGSSLLIVDTPGLYDTELTQKQTLQQIGKVMGITSPGFHAFIVVVKVGRFTEEEKHSIEMLAKKFGPELYERAVILFTAADNLAADGVEFDDYVKTDLHKDLRKIIQRCGDRTVGFDNRAIGRERQIQVEKLMALIEGIMRLKRGTYYTNEFYKAAERIIEQERQQRLEQDNTKTEEEVTHEIRQEIEEEKGFFPKFFGVIEGITSSIAENMSCIIS